MEESGVLFAIYYGCLALSPHILGFLFSTSETPIRRYKKRNTLMDRAKAVRNGSSEPKIPTIHRHKLLPASEVHPPRFRMARIYEACHAKNINSSRERGLSGARGSSWVRRCEGGANDDCFACATLL